jgi:hypothetical protein
MPQPDPKLVPFPNTSGSVQTKSVRDPRLDALRGLALVMIFINHVPGNPFEGFTNRNFGFSDAAEGFFVLSGTAAGLAYSSRMTNKSVASGGLWAGVRPMWARAWTLYLVQLFLTAWAIAIFALGASYFGLPQLLTQINLKQVFLNTDAALAGIPLLGHQLGYVNILPAYTTLLLVGPLMIYGALRRPKLVILASVAVWFVAGVFRLNFPNFPNPGGWFFNPFSWQIIFTVGLLIGVKMRQGERLVPKSKPLLYLTAGYLVFVLLWMKIPPLASLLNNGLAYLGRNGVPFHIISHDKTFVALPRLLHVLAMVYVLSYFEGVTRAAGSAIAAPFRAMGRQGLLVFSGGTLLSLAFQVLMAGVDHPALPWLLPVAGISMMIAIAYLAEASSKKRVHSIVVTEADPAANPANSDLPKRSQGL